MKILYVNKVSPRFGGGAELRLLEIGKRLAAKGHTVHVICSKTEPNLPDYEQVQGIHTHYISLLPAPIFRFRRLTFYLSRYLFYFLSWSFGNLVKQISPDVIIDVISPSPSLIYFIARRSNIPCCAIIHEYFGNSWFRLKDPVTAVLGVISQFLLRHFRYDKIITDSQYTRGELIGASFSPELIEVIPCGIDFEAYRLQNTPKRELNWLVVVGRLVPQKGHRFLLEALMYVKKSFPCVRLHVIGDGPLRADLEQLFVKADLEENVTFLGWVSNPVKIEYLWRSSVLVMPSLQEGFGIALLEAMACGVAIIAFDLQVYREFMNHNCGSFVPVMDSHAMAMQIIHLLQDDEARARISRHNLVHVQRYGWDSAAEAEERLLNEMIANRHLCLNQNNF